jgi:hypothetical protein
MSAPERRSSPDPAKDERRREEAERRRLRAKVFGEVLPEGTRDERGDAWGDRESSSDEWLRGQVPPHHG